MCFKETELQGYQQTDSSNVWFSCEHSVDSCSVPARSSMCFAVTDSNTVNGERIEEVASKFLHVKSSYAVLLLPQFRQYGTENRLIQNKSTKFWKESLEKVPHEELHNLFSSRDINRVIKQKRTGWARHAERFRKMHTYFFLL